MPVQEELSWLVGLRQSFRRASDSLEPCAGMRRERVYGAVAVAVGVLEPAGSARPPTNE